jgi:uncharacterized protein
MEDTTAPLAPTAEDFVAYAGLASTRAEDNPRGVSVGSELEIADGDADAFHSHWGTPDAKVSLHTWVANPADYPVDGDTRQNFTEICALMSGWCTVLEEGKAPVEMRAGDTYVLQPGWTGTWVVRERAVKCVLHVYE